MKRAAQHDAGSDDDGSRRRMPRVIRNAIDGARGQPLPGGYSPAVSFQVPSSHRWARYDVVVSALRSLTSRNLFERAARVAARATLDGLFEHPAPFDAGMRFPEGALYLSLDHGKFGAHVYRIKQELQRLEATTGNGEYTSTGKNTVAACVSFMEAVGEASGALSSAFGEEDADKPVLYDRDVFEEAFGLTWTLA